MRGFGSRSTVLWFKFRVSCFTVVRSGSGSRPTTAWGKNDRHASDGYPHSLETTPDTEAVASSQWKFGQRDGAKLGLKDGARDGSPKQSVGSRAKRQLRPQVIYVDTSMSAASGQMPRGGPYGPGALSPIHIARGHQSLGKSPTRGMMQARTPPW
eukprot:6174906-Pleurochrysis_carterae.AAC.2